MGVGQRIKGATFEREIAAKFRELGLDAKRGFQYRGGYDAPDVDVQFVHVECKRHKSVKIQDAYRQSKAEAKNGKIPIVVSKDNNGEVLVTMSWNNWAEFFKKWITLGTSSIEVETNIEPVETEIVQSHEDDLDYPYDYGPEA